ncbi:glycerol-3-phosphate acyltransferase [Deinococcus radiophilus]|uniref:Glycerol-3-phosphate acyltransferase n=1 Tax=Deinococcus radiophilus TaxID=32062 RepID=A0A3S0KF46_9DEIO|nr:glycerol-3-phosphate acyltransferase [Deinococcus radiophilus]RTR29412.1 glycerol-3-phosphate acyltransferase [Deinococcus radiophilus]UFA50760.1 glycerol-3-phosphate acyltransferase [Deinococcus radiophilus]
MLRLLTRLAVPAAAFVIGSLPLGHWLLARRQKDTRLNSPYNLGVENVLERLGPELALGTAGLDAAKGAAAVALAPTPPLALAAGVAAYLGHLNPPSALYGDTLPRGRGNLVLLGVFVALSRQGYGGAALLPLVAYGAALAGTRYPALATVAGLGTFTVATLADRRSTGEQLLASALLLSAAWRFKENLGRILDGTEPRLGDPVPLAGKRDDQVVTAFMIHPMKIEDFWTGTPRFAWLRPLYERGLVGEELVGRIAAQFRPMKVGELRGIQTEQGKEIYCYLLSAPLLPDMFRDDPELATRRAIEGARLAQELGAEVFGLGAFWSVVGNKGEAVQEAVPELTVTNGGAYTSGTIKAAIPGILEHFSAQGRDLKHATAAVVGANGVVAFGIARTIAPQVGKVIMVGRNLERLERSAATLRRANPDTEIVTTTSYDTLKEAELIFTATSDPDPVIFAEQVRPGAWIFDEGRPADVDEGVRDVPGVRVIPGGVVLPPGNMTSRIDLQFGEGAVPACLAETLIIAATGEHDRKSLGMGTKTENVNFFVDKAQELGFTVLD